MYRFDDLPRGQLQPPCARAPDRSPDGLVQTLEFRPVPAIRQMLATQGRVLPATGQGSIVYVIAAYNNGDFQTIKMGGVDRQVFGFEWGYLGSCPTMENCGPIASGTVHFNASACFAIRTDQGNRRPIRCVVSGGATMPPSSQVSKPIRSGQAFVSIRSIVPATFADGQIYFGGYDCNFYPADGTAWVASSSVGALDLTLSSKGDQP